MDKTAVDYWDNFFNDENEIDLELFNYKELSRTTKKRIFKKYVGVINLETSNYCNRKCSYCPVEYSNRGQEKKHMKEKVYDKIINDLKEIDYNHQIMLNLFNEPLANDDIFNKIYKARKKLKEASIVFNSNGDFLTKEKLDRLVKVGNDAIFITLHASEKYSDEKQLEAIESFFNRIDLRYNISKFESNKSILIKQKYKGMRIKVMSNNWDQYGNYRAGTVDELKTEKIRERPCMKPIREFTISQQGDVYPCCNCFPGDDKLSKFIAGNVKNKDIFDIYNSKVLADFRRDLFNFGPKKFPCNFCSDKDNAKLDSIKIRNKILNQATEI